MMRNSWVALLLLAITGPAGAGNTHDTYRPDALIDVPRIGIIQGPEILAYLTQNTPALAHIFEYHWHLLLTSMVGLLLGMAVAIAYTMRLNRHLQVAQRLRDKEIGERRRAEASLRQSESALRALHDITTARVTDFDAKMHALLVMGCERLGLPVGLLSHVEGDRYEVVQAVTPNNSIARGQIFELGQTYCVETLRTDAPVGFEHAATSEWRSHPAYRFCRLEAYLGIRIEAGGQVYGTLNFMSPAPRVVRFTETDKGILKLMAQWVGSVIERRDAEDAMRKLSTALEGTADSVAIADRDGRIEYVNPAFEQVTGYTCEEVRGKTLSLLRSGRHDREFYEELWQTILQGRPFHALFINRRKGGELYHEEKTITPLIGAKGAITHFVSTSRDVTALYHANERLRQHQAEVAHSARVSAMGEMPSALAHELSQPLAAIASYAQGCLRRLRAGATDARDLKEALQHIDLYARQSGEIVGRLRRFLRKSEPRRRPADINQIVREAAELANVEARWRGVRLTLELAGDLPPVWVDAIQIEQVVVNLVHNAVEAIDAAAPAERWVKVQTVRGPDDKLDILVSDSGPGLPAQVLDHLFDPFFTTKPNGMGLGLSISRAIIEAHEGALRAHPAGSGGAVFCFSLRPIPEREMQA
jgi:PAS domain S-box-containing protein